MKVGEYFGHDIPTAPLKPSRSIAYLTRVGVEIELENLRPSSAPDGWNVTSDGSLRNNGVEFVFRNGAGGTTAVTRLEKMKKYLEGAGKDAQVTDRCSVHVHVDARDMTPAELRTFIALYVAVEPYLFWVCGYHRSDNIYCPAVYKAKEQLKNLSEVLSLRSDQDMMRAIRSDRFAKYSSINVRSLRELGTVEFRGHEGTKDMDQILRWINVLVSMKGFAKAEGMSVDTLFQMTSTAENALEILVPIFGNLAEGVPNGILDECMDTFANVGTLINEGRIKEEFVTVSRKSHGKPNPLVSGFLERYGIRWEPYRNYSSGLKYRFSARAKAEISSDVMPEFSSSGMREIIRVLNAGGRLRVSVPSELFEQRER